MFFNEKTLAYELGISEEQGREFIDGLLNFKFVWEAELNSGKQEEKICQYRAGCNFISFLTFAHILLHQPSGFNFQNTDRHRPYFINDTYRKKEKTNERES